MDFLEKLIIFLTRVGKMLKGGKSGFFRIGLLSVWGHKIATVTGRRGHWVVYYTSPKVLL